VLRTLGLLLGGYAIAAVLGVAVGVLMGWSRRADCLLEPLTELLRPIPKPALVPPLFLFLGIGLPTMLTIVALVAFFPILINTAQGVRAIDPVLLDTARTFRASRRSVLLRVVLPAALPMVMTGLRVSLALGLILAILAEMLAGQGGIGFVILDLQRSFDTTAMFAWLIILAALGLLLAAGFDFIERRVLPWRAA
jgi:ABC-type nitrate/sulfonate/bicarbonate transport system permease component